MHFRSTLHFKTERDGRSDDDDDDGDSGDVGDLMMEMVECWRSHGGDGGDLMVGAEASQPSALKRETELRHLMSLEPFLTSQRCLGN